MADAAIAEHDAVLPIVEEGDDRMDEDPEEEQAEDEESQVDEDDASPFMLPELMGPDDPLRMALTNEEHEWAMNIKIAIESSPEIDNLSDFMYAQYALVCHGNTEDVVRYAEAMQHFREEYGIVESCQQGSQIIRQYVSLLPQNILHFGFSFSEGTYVLAQDVARFDCNVFSGRRVEVFLVACYYIAHTCFPDFESIRKGLISMSECDGMDWSKKPDFKLFQKLFGELWSCYPLAGKFHHYHTNVFFNLMGALLKKVLPPSVKDKFYFGMTCDGRLDAICLIPTPEAASQRVLQEMGTTLRLRYENESNFSLVES